MLQTVHGPGGVDKSRLAVEYAYRHADRYDVIWRLRADDESAMLADYVALGARLGLVAQAERTWPMQPGGSSMTWGVASAGFSSSTTCQDRRRSRRSYLAVVRVVL